MNTKIVKLNCVTQFQGTELPKDEDQHPWESAPFGQLHILFLGSLTQACSSQSQEAPMNLWIYKLLGLFLCLKSSALFFPHLETLLVSAKSKQLSSVYTTIFYYFREFYYKIWEIMLPVRYSFKPLTIVFYQQGFFFRILS